MEKEFKFIVHALTELQRRKIPLQVVQEALQSPEQIVPAAEGRVAYHKRIDVNGTTYLLRIIVENSDTVVTVYRTSKIDKYWSEETDDAH